MEQQLVAKTIANVASWGFFPDLIDTLYCTQLSMITTHTHY